MPDQVAAYGCPGFRSAQTAGGFQIVENTISQPGNGHLISFRRGVEGGRELFDAGQKNVGVAGANHLVPCQRIRSRKFACEVNIAERVGINGNGPAVSARGGVLNPL